MVLQPKQVALGGKDAWIGGNDAILRADVKSVVYLFVMRRLQALAKVLYIPDLTQVTSLNFEAMLQAIESLAPDESFQYDHTAYRGLYESTMGP